MVEISKKQLEEIEDLILTKGYTPLEALNTVMYINPKKEEIKNHSLN